MLTFYVEDQLHGRRRMFSDDPVNSFLHVARRLSASGSNALDVINPYADAMLNFIQIDRLIPELEAAMRGCSLSVPERELVGKVLDAAREARELGGYLFVEGD